MNKLFLKSVLYFYLIIILITITALLKPKFCYLKQFALKGLFWPFCFLSADGFWFHVVP